MDYSLMYEQIRALAQTDAHLIPLLSNACAVVYEEMNDVNWAGFYLLRNGQLVVGPFQGKPACIHIAIGKGVCGTAVMEKRTIRVDDVHAFPGHIACDAASAAEIVLPLSQNGRIFGVLDIDSPVKNRFTADDEEGLSRIASLIGECAVIDGAVDRAEDSSRTL